MASKSSNCVLYTPSAGRVLNPGSIEAGQEAVREAVWEAIVCVFRAYLERYSGRIGCGIDCVIDLGIPSISWRIWIWNRRQAILTGVRRSN
jgi:hypothetical protein